MAAILTIIVALVIVGVALYLIGLIPMDPRILNAIRAIVILLVVLWIFSVLFGWTSLPVVPRGARVL